MAATGANPRILGGARVQRAAKVLPPKGWVLPRQVPAENALLYMRRGRGEIVLGEQPHPARRDRVYLIRRGQPYLIRAHEDQVLEHWCIHFELFDAAGQPLELDALRLPEVIPAVGRSTFERLFVQCMDCYARREPGSHAALLASFFAILDRLLEATNAEQPVNEAARDREGQVALDAARSRQTAQVMSAVELMMQQVCGDLRLDELAARADMSPSHFEKVFKRVTGRPPHVYYTGLKMEQAKTLMAADSVTLSEIAARLGFTSLHHFSRTFKQYEGKPPSQYAREMKSR